MNHVTRLPVLAAWLACLTAPQPGHAAPRPLWELGAGIAILRLPDYRGSDAASMYALPIPYVVYRGDFIKADRNGVRATWFDSNQLEINLSINGTLPVHSKHNAARRGMADLKPTIEVGPTVDFHLWRAADMNATLDLRAPLRTSITLESSPRQIGWLFSPQLAFNIYNASALPGWHIGLVAGPLFHDRRYNAHFYSVPPADVTAIRPAYAAGGGYAGTQVTLSLSKRFARYWFGAFLRHDSVAGAVFEDSPLVGQRGAVSAGFAFSWVFGESATRVEAEE